MRNVVLATMVLLSSSSLGGAAALINARDHTCSQIAEIIRQQKDVFVRVGFGGRSFRYPPARCDLGEKRDTTGLRDASGRQCLLDYACVYDPDSFYNFRSKLLKAPQSRWFNVQTTLMETSSVEVPILCRAG